MKTTMQHNNSLKFQLVLILVILLALLLVTTGCSEDNNPVSNNNNTGGNEQILFQATEYSINNSFAGWLYKDTLWQTQQTLHKVKFEFRIITQLQAGYDSSYFNVQAFGSTVNRIYRMSYSSDSVYSFTIGSDSVTLAPNFGSFKIGCKNLTGNAFIKVSDIKITKIS